MKKLNYLLLAVMTILFAASCSQDETLSVESGDASTVTFTVDVPESGPQTRAIGDGTQATHLFYAVYDLENNLLTEKNETADYPHTVSISLAKDQEYQIAFWAQDPNCNAYTTTDLKIITIDYNGLNNDESRDAFYHSQEFKVDGSTIPVTLTRPFAQLNVGTADYAKATTSGLEIKFSEVTIKQAASKINLLTGETSEPVDVEFAYNEIPSETEVLNVNSVSYRYLSMSYILVDNNNNKDNVTLEYKFSTEAKGAGKTVEFKSGLTEVPVQPNYRTNIVGNLLTESADFDISIDDDFEGDDNVTMPTVSDKQGLEAALANPVVTDIFVDGTIGSEGDYTIYNIDRPVTIQGLKTRASEGAKVFGSFVVKSEGVTIDNLSINNRGDLELSNGKTESSTNRGGIYVYAEKITITNNTFTNGLGDNAGLSNAIQLMSPKKDNPLSNYVVKGNKIIGHANEVTNWSSSGIVIAQNYTPGSVSMFIEAILATQADYEKLLDENEFESNLIDLTHQDWTNNVKTVLFSYSSSAENRVKISHFTIRDNVTSYEDISSTGDSMLGYYAHVNIGGNKPFKVEDTESFVIKFLNNKSEVLGSLTLNEDGYSKVKTSSGIGGTINLFGEYVSSSWDAEYFGKWDKESFDYDITEQAVKVEASVKYKDGGYFKATQTGLIDKDGASHHTNYGVFDELVGEYAIGTLRLYADERWHFNFGTTNDLKIKGDIAKLSMKLSDGNGKHVVTRTLKSEASVSETAHTVSISIPYKGSSWDIVYGESIDEAYLKNLVYEDPNAETKVVNEIPADYTLEAYVKYNNGPVVTKKVNRTLTLNVDVYWQSDDKKAINIKLPEDATFSENIEKIAGSYPDLSMEKDGNIVTLTRTDKEAFSGDPLYKFTIKKDSVNYSATLQLSGHVGDKNNPKSQTFYEIKNE